MTCIKTGAVVLVEPYGGLLVCDLFRVGDVIFANEGTDRIRYDQSREATHKVNLSCFGNEVHPTKFIAATADAWQTL